MKKSTFSESQIVAVLKEGEAGVPTLRTPSVMLKRPMEFENASGGGSRRRYPWRPCLRCKRGTRRGGHARVTLPRLGARVLMSSRHLKRSFLPARLR
jgi:hypothetical protein